MVVNDELVRGLRFAHHVTQAELMAGWLDVVPDFAALAALRPPLHASRRAGQVEVVEPEPEDLAAHELAGLVLRGPDGWLDGANADRLVVLSIDGSRLTVAFEDTSATVAVDPTPVVATFERLGGGQPVPLLDLVLHLLIDHPALFEATPPTPLRDLLLVAGLDVDGTTVHRADLRPAARGADPVGLPGLGISSALAAERLLAGVLTVDATPVGRTTCSTPSPTPTPSPRWPSRSSAALWCRRTSWPASSSTSRRRDRPDTHAGVSFLRSRLAEWQGDATAQEAALDAAARSAQQPAALVDAAWFAADRGDARAALALLRSAHVPADDPDLELLVRYTAGGPRLVGRNDPCWCGSGRKHKHCCLRLNGHDLESRATWLHAKAVTFLQRPPQRGRPAGRGHRQRRRGLARRRARPRDRRGLRRDRVGALPLRRRRSSSASSTSAVRCSPTTSASWPRSGPPSAIASGRCSTTGDGSGTRPRAPSAPSMISPPRSSRPAGSSSRWCKTDHWHSPDRPSRWPNRPSRSWPRCSRRASRPPSPRCWAWSSDGPRRPT